MSEFDGLMEEVDTVIAEHFGDMAVYHYDVDIPTIVVIDRGVAVPTEDGLQFVERTVVTLLKSDVGGAKLDATITTSQQVMTIGGFVFEDDQIVKVYVSCQNL